MTVDWRRKGPIYLDMYELVSEYLQNKKNPIVGNFKAWFEYQPVSAITNHTVPTHIVSNNITMSIRGIGIPY